MTALAQEVGRRRPSLTRLMTRPSPIPPDVLAGIARLLGPEVAGEVERAHQLASSAARQAVREVSEAIAGGSDA